MKQIMVLLLVALLTLGVAMPVMADEPVGGNYHIMGHSAGQAGVSPPTIVVPVRYAMRTGGVMLSESGLSSGDVVIWDTVSGDGFTISACVTTNDGTYAGVLISDIQTADSSIFNRSSRNWGKMAIKGYCLVSIDSGRSTAGQLLSTAGNDPSGAFETGAAGVISRDIGTLISDSGTGTTALSEIWLN